MYNMCVFVWMHEHESTHRNRTPLAQRRTGVQRMTRRGSNRAVQIAARLIHTEFTPGGADRRTSPAESGEVILLYTVLILSLSVRVRERAEARCSVCVKNIPTIAYSHCTPE